MSPETAGPVFTREGETWVPSAHARGPWDPQQLHGGAPAALLARELERLDPGADMLVARITYDFLGPVPMAPLEVTAEIEKPGARFQVVSAELHAAGDDRVAVRVRGVRLRRGTVEDPPALAADPVPALEDGQEITPFGTITDTGFHPTAVDVRIVRGSRGSGAAAAWFRLRRPVVEGEAPSPLQRVVAAADFGNGISHSLPFDAYLFVNCDLSVHLHREAVGEWVALDSRTAVGPQGVAQATSVLHDTRGPIGYAAQSLFVERR